MLMGMHDGVINEGFLKVGIFALDHKNVVRDVVVGTVGKSNIGAVLLHKINTPFVPGFARMSRFRYKM